MSEADGAAGQLVRTGHAWRRARAGLAVAGARVRAQPGRAALLAVGIAAATAMLIGVLGGSLVAQDRAVRRAVADLPVGQRTFRVDLIGLPAEQSSAQADRSARATLAALSPEQPLRVLFFRDFWLDGEFVRLVGVDGLAGLVHLRSGRLPTACRPKACEVLQIGDRGKRLLSEGGINVVRTGVADLGDVGAYGPAFTGLLKFRAQRSLVRTTLLVASGADAFERIPPLRLLFRVQSWIAPLDPARIHSWQIAGVLERESRAQTELAEANPSFAFSGPDAALIDAHSRGTASADRMLLIGGGASTLLLGFAIVAAISMRRGLGAERRRLLQRGATRPQVWLAFVAEVGTITLAGWIAGIAAGIVAVAAIARGAGSPAGPILEHALLRPWSLLALVLALLIATGVVVVAAVSREQESRLGRLRLLDVAALGAALAIAVGFARGGLNADTLGSGGDRTLLLILPGLVCFAGAVAAGRLLRPAMLLAERLSRRGPISGRLALLALARAPARTVATVSFLVVAVALAAFAAGYRATLKQEAADESAFAVPLDLTLSEGSRLVLPLDAAPLERYDRLGPGVRAYPILRRSAVVAGAGASAASISVLGVPRGALAGMHWRSDFASASRSTLVHALGRDGTATLRGTPIPRGARTLSLPMRLRGARLSVALVVQDARGRTRIAPLGTAAPGASTLQAHIPPGSTRVTALALSLPEAERDWFFHNAIEGRTVLAPSGSLALGPLSAGGSRLVDWRGWSLHGRSTAVQPSAAGRFAYSFPQIETLVVRPAESTDNRPLGVVVSPGVARSVGPRGTLTLDFQDARIPARIVGVARRFPTLSGVEFAVADESRLATALEADAPGTGTPGELWLSVPGRSVRPVEAGLAQPSFDRLVQASRRQLASRIDGDPLTRAIVYALGAAALFAIVLAAVGFWIALLGELRDERGDFFDLEAQGVSPSTLRRHLRVRVAALLAFGVVGGLLLGLVLSRLVVSLVRVSADTSAPEPPLVFSPGWTTLGLVLAALVVVALASTEVSTRRAFRGDTPRRAAGSLE